jgi:hypothetical protein
MRRKEEKSKLLWTEHLILNASYRIILYNDFRNKRLLHWKAGQSPHSLSSRLFLIKPKRTKRLFQIILNNMIYLLILLELSILLCTSNTLHQQCQTLAHIVVNDPSANSRHFIEQGWPFHCCSPSVSCQKRNRKDSQ